MSELPEKTIEVEFLNFLGDPVPTRVKVDHLQFYVRDWAEGKDGFVSLEGLREFLNPPKPEPAAKKVNVRNRLGTAPHWNHLLGPVIEAEDGEWQVYVENVVGKTWRLYKVVSKSPEGVPAKANYELSSDHKRVALSKAHQLMKAHRPELFKKFEEWVTTHKIR
jgi:hypothetical protein